MRALALTLVFSGVLLVGSGSWIHMKAQVAQWLLEGAWVATTAGLPAVRPWPWADGYPVARIRSASGADLIVLAGSSGRNLAFAPGHLEGTGLPGEDRYAVVGGHRDTHFSFLRDLTPGDLLTVQSRDGQWHRYQVEQSQIADIRTDRLPLQGPAGKLLLITCWPFDALMPGGPLRYLVSARKLDISV